MNPGNSGGPVFNHAGCVIGMVTFKASENSEGLSFALSHKLISNFLENPKIDQESISKASLGKFSSNGQFVELWNGIYTGMNKNQVKNVLGGNAKCWEVFNKTYCNTDPILLAGEEAVPTVIIQNLSKGKLTPGTVKQVMLHVRSKYKCKSKDLIVCAKEKKSNHYKSLEYVNTMLSQKYGRPIFNESKTGYLFFDNKVKIELLSVSDGGDPKISEFTGPDIGIWLVRYTLDQSNL